MLFDTGMIIYRVLSFFVSDWMGALFKDVLRMCSTKFNKSQWLIWADEWPTIGIGTIYIIAKNVLIRILLLGKFLGPEVILI